MHPRVSFLGQLMNLWGWVRFSRDVGRSVTILTPSASVPWGWVGRQRFYTELVSISEWESRKSGNLAVYIWPYITEQQQIVQWTFEQRAPSGQYQFTVVSFVGRLSSSQKVRITEVLSGPWKVSFVERSIIWTYIGGSTVGGFTVSKWMFQYWSKQDCASLSFTERIFAFTNRMLHYSGLGCNLNFMLHWSHITLPYYAHCHCKYLHIQWSAHPSCYLQ